MSSTPARLRELLERLLVAEIDFILVGGLAVNAWGYLRGTHDIDIVPSPSPQNLDCLASELETINGKVKVGERLLSVDSTRTMLRSGDRALVITDLGELDVLQGLAHIPRYEELDATASPSDLDGLSVRVCSLQHLLEMKRIANRHRDRDDIEALRAAHPELPDER